MGRVLNSKVLATAKAKAMAKVKGNLFSIQKEAPDIDFGKKPKTVNITFNGAFVGEWAENIPPELRVKISETVKNTDFDAKKYVDTGADGVVYKLDGFVDFPSGIAVKISHETDKSPDSGQMQRTNSTFKNERIMLPKVRGLNKGSQEFIGYLKTLGGKNILLTTFVKGEDPDIEKRVLNKENLKNILIALNKLDEKRILHRDLKKENVKVEENNAIGLLDYGEAIDFDLLQFEKNVNENHFAAFEVPANTKNFESTLLMPYLDNLMKKDKDQGLELFREYLKLKSEYTYKPTVQMLERLIAEASSGKSKLKKMLDYQTLTQKVLQDPAENIVEIELLKAQIVYNSELAYKNEILLLNPLANVAIKLNAMLTCKQYEKAAKEFLKRPNPIDIKKYYEYQVQYASYHILKLSYWTQQLMEQILKCLKMPLEKAQECNEEMVNQFLKRNLQNFEIPTIWRN